MSKNRIIIKYNLIILLALAFAMPVAAQNRVDGVADSRDVATFEREEAPFIAQEMSDDEYDSLIAADAIPHPAIATAKTADTTKTADDDGLGEAKEHYHGWVANVVSWYMDHMSYTAVGLLMTIESSFIPFPSEIVIPPAVMAATDPLINNNMKWWIIFIIGTLGALLGAYINYFLSRWLGRPIIYKFADSKLGHLLSLSGEKVERAEKYFIDHGVVSTLVGRLIPVIRQLISIPAGLSKMNIGVFSVYTLLGAGIWNAVLCLLGHLAVKAGGMEFIYKYSGLLSKIIIVVFAIACVWLIARAVIRKRKAGKTNTPDKQ